MAFRIGNFIVRGELFNLDRNSVHGWLDFGNDEGIRLELTGNMEGDLAGKHIRFHVESPPGGNDEDRASLDALAFQQIGPTGNMLLRMLKVPRCSNEEFIRRCREGDRPPVDEKPCLYLEWFSQNGRVVAEIIDPVLAYGPEENPDEDEVVPEPLPDPDDVGLGVTGFMKNEAGEIEEVSFDQDPSEKDADPYELFPADLEAQLKESSDIPFSSLDEDGAELTEGPRGMRPWDEVIPGIDPETKKMYEEWDEVLHGENHEPIATMFDPPLALKPPDEISDEAEANAYLQMILQQLALYAVAIDMCEHFTALQTYRWLIEDILPGCHISRKQPKSGFVMHYATSDDCPECEARFDAEYEQGKYDK